VSDLYIPRIGAHISLQQNRQTDPGNIKIFHSWETKHYNSVLEITFSFLGIYKWEPDIYIGFSPALHLQCGMFEASPAWHDKAGGWSNDRISLCMAHRGGGGGERSLGRLDDK
jgi:hypothetical protein